MFSLSVLVIYFSRNTAFVCTLVFFNDLSEKSSREVLGRTNGRGGGEVLRRLCDGSGGRRGVAQQGVVRVAARRQILA